MGVLRLVLVDWGYSMGLLLSRVDTFAQSARPVVSVMHLLLTSALRGLGPFVAGSTSFLWKDGQIGVSCVVPRLLGSGAFFRGFQWFLVLLMANGFLSSLTPSLVLRMCRWWENLSLAVLPGLSTRTLLDCCLF